MRTSRNGIWTSGASGSMPRLTSCAGWPGRDGSRDTAGGVPGGDRLEALRDRDELADLRAAHVRGVHGGFVVTVAEAPKYPARIFSSAEVCVAAEVSYRKVDFWLSRGYIPAAEPQPGSGQPRRFTFGEALAIAVMARLVDAGVNPRDAQVSQVLETGTFGTPPVQIRVD